MSARAARVALETLRIKETVCIRSTGETLPRKSAAVQVTLTGEQLRRLIDAAFEAGRVYAADQLVADGGRS